MRRFGQAFSAFLVAISLSTAACSEETVSGISEEALKNADRTKGQTLFTQNCGACHTLMVGGGNLLGPNFGELFKRKVASKEGYDYSDALKGADFEWSPDKLAEWLRFPETFLPGNKMPVMSPMTDEDIIPLISYMMVRTGSVEWGTENVLNQNVANTEGLKLTPLEKVLYDTRQDFWHHLFENTAHYEIMKPDGGSYTFVAYFNEDGTLTGNNRGVKGFWRVNDLKWFCYAIEGLPVTPFEWTECFPIVPGSVERYGEGLWESEPVPGVKVKGGFLQGRPHPLAGDAHPGYWENLFANTMRYEVRVDKEVKIVNAHFNEDRTISSPEGVSGKWSIKGEGTGNEEMCYTLSNISMFEEDLSECFALVLMFDPRIGARWPSRFENGTMYWAEVVEGRDSVN